MISGRVLWGEGGLQRISSGAVLQPVFQATARLEDHLFRGAPSQGPLFRNPSNSNFGDPNDPPPPPKTEGGRQDPAPAKQSPRTANCSGA